MITNKKICIKELAEVLSGVYEKPDPEGEVAYLQTKDCTDSVVLKLASRVQLTPKMQKNLLRQGDVLLVAGRHARVPLLVLAPSLGDGLLQGTSGRQCYAAHS